MNLRVVSYITFIVVCFISARVWTDPFRRYRHTHSADEFTRAIERLPVGTSRQEIERKLGKPNCHLSKDVMLKYANEFVPKSERGDTSVAYQMNEGTYKLQRACVLRYSKGVLVGRREFYWTQNYTLVGPL